MGCRLREKHQRYLSRSLLRLDIDFKDLQSRLFHFHRLGSFHENTFHELCRFPSASFTDGPLPPQIPSRALKAVTRGLPRRAMERVRTQRRNVAYIGFHTRFTPCLPSSVKVLFQTGNTLGVIPLTIPSQPPSSFRRQKILRILESQA